MKWYILQSYANQEKSVLESIKEKVEKAGLANHIAEVIIPTEKVMEVKRGKKVSVEKRFLPGYILIKMELSDALWHVIRRIPKVTGFLGADGKPQEVSEAEIQRITRQIETNAVAREMALRFEIGESVKVNDGPFESFVGVIEGVDEAKQRVKVSVTIFGRSTPVDLEFSQVIKV